MLWSAFIIGLWVVFLYGGRIKRLGYFHQWFGVILSSAGLVLYFLHASLPFPHASGILFLSGIGMMTFDIASWMSGGRLRIWGNLYLLVSVAISVLTSFVFMSSIVVSTEFLVALVALNALLITAECAMYAVIIGPISEFLLFLRPYFRLLLTEASKSVALLSSSHLSWEKAMDVLTFASEGVFAFPVILLPFSAAIFALLAMLHFEWFGLWVMISFWLTLWHPIIIPLYFEVLLYAVRRETGRIRQSKPPIS